MNRNKITIGLFGFGCVGYGLYEVLQLTPGLAVQIKTICVKDRNKARPIAQEHFTFDKNDILNDDAINVVVELTDDAEEAFAITSAALQRGKAVVTANKKMVAEHFEELLELQRRYNTPLLYEAACCASIPIIRNLEEYYDNDLLESVEGIVNGSTNYILSQTWEKGLTPNEALKEAQRLGYAESNPELDVSGADARYKLLILMAHAFGIVAQPEDIVTSGIDRLGAPETKYARQHGLKIKLVAQAYRKSDGSVASVVLPKYVAPDSKLYHVDDVYNGIITHTGFAQNQFFMGRGAGAYPTASAVLSDLSALSYNYRYEYKKLQQATVVPQIANDDVVVKAMLRYPKDAHNQYHELFLQAEESYFNCESAYTIGQLTLKNIHEATTQNPDVCVVLLN